MTPQIERKLSEESHDPPSSDGDPDPDPDHPDFRPAPFSPPRALSPLGTGSFDETRELFPEAAARTQPPSRTAPSPVLVAGGSPGGEVPSSGDDELGDFSTEMPHRALHALSAGPSARQIGAVVRQSHTAGVSPFGIGMMGGGFMGDAFSLQEALPEELELEEAEVLSEEAPGRREERGAGGGFSDDEGGRFSATGKLSFQMGRGPRKRQVPRPRAGLQSAPMRRGGLGMSLPLALESNKYFLGYLELKEQLLQSSAVQAVPFTRVFVFLHMLFTRARRDAHAHAMLRFLAARASESSANPSPPATAVAGRRSGSPRSSDLWR